MKAASSTTRPKSFARLHTVSTCLAAMTQLIAISEEREEHARAPKRFAPFAAEKYAFRDAVCRRKITPRSAWCPIAACV